MMLKQPGNMAKLTLSHLVTRKASLLLSFNGPFKNKIRVTLKDAGRSEGSWRSPLDTSEHDPSELRHRREHNILHVTSCLLNICYKLNVEALDWWIQRKKNAMEPQLYASNSYGWRKNTIQSLSFWFTEFKIVFGYVFFFYVSFGVPQLSMSKSVPSPDPPALLLPSRRWRLSWMRKNKKFKTSKLKNKAGRFV